MYSEKLKKLVLDKTPLKFRIKDAQQSKEFQEFLFALNVNWGSNEKEIQSINTKFLYYDPKYNHITRGDSEFNFIDHENSEFCLENDCVIEEKKDKYQTANKIEIPTWVRKTIIWEVGCKHCGNLNRLKLEIENLEIEKEDHIK